MEEAINEAEIEVQRVITFIKEHRKEESYLRMYDTETKITPKLRSLCSFLDNHELGVDEFIHKIQEELIVRKNKQIEEKIKFYQQDFGDE